MYQMRGLGVVMNADGSYYVPSWCSWLPFSSFNDACKLPTAGQIASDNLSNLGGAAKSNPALVASLKSDWAASDAQQCELHPDLCREYQYAVDYPDVSAAIGPSYGAAVGDAVDAVTGAVSDAAKAVAMNWGLIAIVLGVGVFAVVAAGSGSPRRYGR